MPLDAVAEIRMDSEVKSEVEELYRNLGSSFEEAVRVFARESLREGGLPFRPRLLCWEDMREEDVDALILRGMTDLAAGRVHSQEEVDARVEELYQRAKSEAR